MFASLSAFLPSSLQQPPQLPRPHDGPQPSSPRDAPAADPPRRKEKKEKHPNEAFIIVRPPPSKSTHPLNLQLQLVPPQSRHERPVHALDASPDDFSTDLKRTTSERSETSSGYTSAGSVSSFASTSTTSSGRRMIVPLYNLNVHSVMPTSILDAGTDAKVAKFTKRGLEVIDLAFLEPIELRPSAPANGPCALSPILRASLDNPFHESGSSPSPRPVSPIRPHTSHSVLNPSEPHKPIINLIPAPPLPPPDLQPQQSSKKLFARMFRKKDSSSQPPIPVPFPNDITLQHSVPPNILRSEEAPVSLPDPSVPDPSPSSPLSLTTTSQIAVLGVYSTLCPPLSNPRDRPSKYIWVVRKWLRGTDTGILNGVIGKLGANARDTNVPGTRPIELRFEWSREPKKTSARKSRPDKISNTRESHSPVPRGTISNTLPRVASQTLHPNLHDHRSSVVSHNSSGSDTAASLTSCSVLRRAEESDEESDPEDSETPWTCTVAVERLGQPPQHHQNNDGVRQSGLRIKVATLAPTPHHPKVVGLLKVPFPLPDIEVEYLAVRRRHVTAQGTSKTSSKAGEFILTAEEIKDTVSSTAFWLVVREAFGGLGRERKKGKS